MEELNGTDFLVQVYAIMYILMILRNGTVQNAWDNSLPRPNGGKLGPTRKNEVKVKTKSGQKQD